MQFVKRTGQGFLLSGHGLGAPAQHVKSRDGHCGDERGDNPTSSPQSQQKVVDCINCKGSNCYFNRIIHSGLGAYRSMHVLRA